MFSLQSCEAVQELTLNKELTIYNYGFDLEKCVAQMGQESSGEGLSKGGIVRICYGILLGKERKRTSRSKVIFINIYFSFFLSPFLPPFLSLYLY